MVVVSAGGPVTCASTNPSVNLQSSRQINNRSVLK